ncbi:MAG: EAL domain-containing protein [Desulfofustis sp.]|nr:EAL domain-containing protein [Desulfofustis sp.]
MDQYIARQPILNVHKRLYAYELLYRGAETYTLQNVSGNRATASLLTSTFLTRGIEEVSGMRPCFINFTQDLLERNLPAAFPKNQLVIEILETVQPTDKLIDVCRKLHDEGYTIALDDFVYNRNLEPLIECADIVKIDVRLTPLDTITRTLNRLQNRKVRLLAEKVESVREFEMANRLGFSYFQGYFFSKPEKIEIKELSSSKVNLLRLLAEVTRKETTLEKLQEIISVDIAISYKLMRFLNSAYFYRLQEVKSVKHAIAYLGERELRRFVLLVVVSELASEQPGELTRLALVRAKFCELLGEASPYRGRADELFIMGLFSLLDTMLGSPMERIMDRLPIGRTVKDALTRKAGVMAMFLQVAEAFERNQHKRIVSLLRELKVNTKNITDSYIRAVRYANGLL